MSDSEKYFEKLNHQNVKKCQDYIQFLDIKKSQMKSNDLIALLFAKMIGL